MCHGEVEGAHHLALHLCGGVEHPVRGGNHLQRRRIVGVLAEGGQPAVAGIAELRVLAGGPSVVGKPGEENALEFLEDNDEKALA